jgi:hypothetical protein
MPSSIRSVEVRLGSSSMRLRHAAAALAIAAGEDVKVVQHMLGHKSATMTLDLFGHLFPDRLDTVADALELGRDTDRAARLPSCPRDSESEGPLIRVLAVQRAFRMATPTGLEPAASAVTGRRANQLRYGARCALPCLSRAVEL